MGEKNDYVWSKKGKRNKSIRERLIIELYLKASQLAQEGAGVNRRKS